MDKDVVFVYTHTHIHIYTHNRRLLSHENEWNNAICSNMDGPRDTKSDRERETSYEIAYMWNL